MITISTKYAISDVQKLKNCGLVGSMKTFYTSAP